MARGRFAPLGWERWWGTGCTQWNHKRGSQCVTRCRRIWHSAEIVVDNPTQNWPNDRQVESAWMALQSGWRFRVEAYPNGQAGHEGWVSAYIHIQPPASLENFEWRRQFTHRLWIRGPQVDKMHVMTFSTLFHKEICSSGKHQFISHSQILWAGWLTADRKLRIIGEVSEAAPLAPQPLSAQCSLELLAIKPEFISFLLHDGSTLYFDKRLLIARSSHFANMLSGEMWREGQTNTIDLRSNKQADSRNMGAAPKLWT